MWPTCADSATEGCDDGNDTTRSRRADAHLAAVVRKLSLDDERRSADDSLARIDVDNDDDKVDAGRLHDGKVAVKLLFAHRCAGVVGAPTESNKIARKSKRINYASISSHATANCRQLIEQREKV